MALWAHGDEKAYIWKQNPAWYREILVPDPEVPGFFYTDYELTDEAPEEARKSFERYNLFIQVGCEDIAEHSPAYLAYKAFCAKEDGEGE